MRKGVNVLETIGKDYFEASYNHTAGVDDGLADIYLVIDETEMRKCHKYVLAMAGSGLGKSFWMIRNIKRNTSKI